MMKMQLSHFLMYSFLQAVNRKAISLLVLLCYASTVHSAINEGYQLTRIEAEPYTQIIQRTGKVDFGRVVNLSFKSSGFLTQLNVDEGGFFEKKQLLAALDTSELKAEKNATYARLLQAKRNIERVKTLLQKKLSSQRDLDLSLIHI